MNMVFLRCQWKERITSCALTVINKRVQSVGIVGMEFAIVSMTLLLLVHHLMTVFLQVVRNDQSVPGVRIFPRCTHDYPLAVVYTEV